MIDPRVRALYYIFLVGPPWKFMQDTTDPVAYGYLRNVTEHVTTVFGPTSVYTEIRDLHNKDKIADYIIKDISK